MALHLSILGYEDQVYNGLRATCPSCDVHYILLFLFFLFKKLIIINSLKHGCIATPLLLCDNNFNKQQRPVDWRARQ